MEVKRKVKAILLDSDFSGREMEAQVKSGFITLDIDKDERYDFFVDRTRPIKVIKDGLLSKSAQDLYIFSWKSLVPLELEQKREILKKDDLINKLKDENFTEFEINQIMTNIEKMEKEGYNFKYFIYKKLEPVEITDKHFSKTQLPSLIRDTSEMRFLKSLRQYVTPETTIGRRFIIFFAILIVLFIFGYALYSAGLIPTAKP